MQRVLSFQMARGLDESSEFVTKRMCFSFLFSVGFLCLLCGFLLGRFTTERTIEYRAEKKRLELAGNGLESTVYIQHRLLRESSANAPLDIINLSKRQFELDSFSALVDIFSNISLFHEIRRHRDCITASVKGSREPDRYVVLSVNEEIGGIGLALIETLNKIGNEYHWRPRRSLIFCVFSGPMDSCLNTFSLFVRRRIVAYIAVRKSSWQTSQCFATSGSSTLRSIVFDVATTVHSDDSYADLKVTPYEGGGGNAGGGSSGGRGGGDTSFNIPHVAFLLGNSIKGEAAAAGPSNGTRCQAYLMQVLSQTVWRLSECLAMKWNQSYLNETIITGIENLGRLEGPADLKEKMQQTAIKLLVSSDKLNRKMDNIESTKVLEIRMLNDISMEMEKILLCPSKEATANTDCTATTTATATPAAGPSRRPSNCSHDTYLMEMIKCYETTVQFLGEWIET